MNTLKLVIDHSPFANLLIVDRLSTSPMPIQKWIPLAESLIAAYEKLLSQTETKIGGLKIESVYAVVSVMVSDVLSKGPTYQTLSEFKGKPEFRDLETTYSDLSGICFFSSDAAQMAIKAIDPLSSNCVQVNVPALVKSFKTAYTSDLMLARKIQETVSDHSKKAFKLLFE